MKLSEKFTEHQVASLMSDDFVIVNDTTTLADAASRMTAAGASSALVMRGEEVAGILTEHDLVRQLAKGIAPQQAVAELMSGQVMSVAANAEVHEAFQLMLAHGIHHLPVVDEHGRPAGMLSESDFRKIDGVAGLLGMATVGDLMNTRFGRLPPASTLEDALKQMATSGERYLIVVDGDAPAGIITEKDVVRTIGRGEAGLGIADLMHPCTATLRENASSAEAARLLREPGVAIIPILGSQGELVGVFGEDELVRHYEGEYIRMLRAVIVAQSKELNENKFYALVNHLPQRIFIKDAKSVFVACNANFAADIGVTPEDVHGKTDLDFFPKELAESYRNADRKVMDEKTSITMEEPYVSPSGKQSWVQTTKAPVIDADGNVEGVVGIYADITEQRRLLEETKQLNWALRAISLSDKAIVYAKSEQEMLQAVCEAITSESRYLLSWIGWKVHDEAHSVQIVASAGVASPYAEGLVVTWAPGPYGNGPSGLALQAGTTQIANHVRARPAFAPWRERAAGFGIHSSAAIPLRMDGETVGVLTIYSGDEEAFGAEETRLFEELADSIAYGVQARRTQAAYDQSLRDVAVQANKLERALEESLAGIGAVLEQRDPYTAGHQQHVAELAVMIAKEMQLDEERIRALYLSAIVHDIGKIQVPTEILSKPARLNAAEFALIKQHPEAGYNVLKKITFPWPIAEIIRQHHEYLDGSGYPRGLRGDQILLESRILTVADIVESMSSDRPYRPALGIEQAASEIANMSGTKLDPAVVAACTAVLKRGDFVPHILALD